MGCGSAVNLENHEKKWKLRPNVNPFLIIKTLTLIFKSSIVLFFQKTNPALFYSSTIRPHPEKAQEAVWLLRISLQSFI